VGGLCAGKIYPDVGFLAKITQNAGNFGVLEVLQNFPVSGGSFTDQTCPKSGKFGFNF